MGSLYVISKPRRPDYIFPCSFLTNTGICRKCGQPYSWTVQFLRQYGQPQTEVEDRETRATALFLEYRRDGIGHCCAEPEHRHYISQNLGMVVYE